MHVSLLNPLSSALWCPPLAALPCHVPSHPLLIPPRAARIVPVPLPLPNPRSGLEERSSGGRETPLILNQVT
ncbi:hypothetical protein E2C01_049648 [Portunus trituberculatus]|uniref:Secreted protein n=1 Tax=Portunus trituberculatus TaxID=210409 RepID=A0A5B7GGM1_PORTR|nr:hypothetical protein [Portunus trituberculatus]